MPQNNQNEFIAFFSWAMNYLYLWFAIIVAFALSYISELKQERDTGMKSSSKILNSLICSILTFPFYLAMDELLTYFGVNHSNSLAIVIGAFLGSIGADKVKAILTAMIARIISIIGGKKE